jgi:hypothetical protein
VSALAGLKKIRIIDLRKNPINLNSFANWEFEEYLAVKNENYDFTIIHESEKTKWGLKNGFPIKM